jgi:hypothetical protein
MSIRDVLSTAGPQVERHLVSELCQIPLKPRPNTVFPGTLRYISLLRKVVDGWTSTINIRRVKTIPASSR